MQKQRKERQNNLLITFKKNHMCTRRIAIYENNIFMTDTDAV